jgi:glycine amidinotransferase
MVKVFTEWEPLHEVIVGDCLNFKADFEDLTFQMVHYANLKNQNFMASPMYANDKLRLKERGEDLENLASVLMKHGVLVRRPEPLNAAHRIVTADWEAIMTAPDQPRDTFMCIGDTIIETPPIIRGRYYESAHYHKIFKDYVIDGAKWIAAPRSSLTMDSLDIPSLTNWKSYHPCDYPGDIPTRFEMAFDAANCLKMGEDILMNIGSRNAELGYYWMQRQLPEFNIVPVYLTDDHLDGVIMPLKPGVFLYNPKMYSEQELRDKLPRPYKMWDLIPTQDEDLGEDYTSEEIMIASEQCMALNVLSLNEKKLLIPKDAKKTIDLLTKKGFEPIPIRFRHTRLFSGGIHCCTTDVRRY